MGQPCCKEADDKDRLIVEPMDLFDEGKISRGGIDGKLLKALDALDLSSAARRLSEIGVRKASDILVLDDNDLATIGLSLVQMRRLQKFLQEDIEGSEALSCVGGSTRPLSFYVRKKSPFWDSQLNRPMRLIFIRHGESEANVDRNITRTVPDHMLHLTAKGREQAIDAGRRLRQLIGTESVKFIVSPYTRTLETFNGIQQAWGNQKLHMRTDVRIREQEYGNFDSPDISQLHKMKRKFGEFYFRFPEGESPADCYERASSFFETMYRSWADNDTENHVIVGHGVMILLMLMRLMRLSVPEWELLDRLKNCEFVVLERPAEDSKYNIAFTWCEGEEQDRNGLRKKSEGEKAPLDIWDGNPDAPIIRSGI